MHDIGLEGYVVEVGFPFAAEAVLVFLKEFGVVIDGFGFDFVDFDDIAFFMEYVDAHEAVFELKGGFGDNAFVMVLQPFLGFPQGLIGIEGIDGNIFGLGIVNEEVFGEFTDLETAFGEGFEEGIIVGLVVEEIGILVVIELGGAFEGNFEFGFGEAGVF